jgi:uncharacterized protein (DUF1697 family)
MSKSRQYAAFLRGVMPTNAKMSELAKAFEAAGFTCVATVLGSGNVAFTASAASESALERKAEAAMDEAIGRHFHTIVRSIDDLRALLGSDPFAAQRLVPGSKRTVTFSRAPLESPRILPVQREGASIVGVRGKEAFSVHVPNPRGPVFMELIKECFGESVTTRTWETIHKVVEAGEAGAKRAHAKPANRAKPGKLAKPAKPVIRTTAPHR